VIVTVDLLQNGEQNHAVLAWGYDDNGIIINDPAFGDTKYLHERYGNDLRFVHGLATFFAPTTEGGDRLKALVAEKARYIQRGIGVSTYAREVFDVLT
jgi:hypothetical protein